MNPIILIRGAGFINKGAEAMIRCVQHGIIAAIPGATGLLDVPRSCRWAAHELRGLEIRAGLDSRARSRRVALTALAPMRRLMPERSRSRYIERCSGCDVDIDALLDISGYGAGDPWIGVGWKERLRTRIGYILLNDVSLLASMDVPIIYLPQSWGPFEDPMARSIADKMVRTATRLYARDQVSLEWLSILPSFSAETASLASDIAFTFEGAPREIGRALLREIGVRLDGPPVIGIVPNMRVYERVRGEGPDNIYVKQLTDVAKHFARDIGCQIAVMPHEIQTMPSKTRDDRYLCELIADVAADAGIVCAALDEYSSEELKAMIGETELLVSSRFHSIVAAMSLRVPVVCVAWSHKYGELMDSVGLGEYVVEHKQLEHQSLVDLCDQAWNQRELMLVALDAAVPHHEISARKVIDDTVALIQERTG